MSCDFTFPVTVGLSANPRKSWQTHWASWWTTSSRNRFASSRGDKGISECRRHFIGLDPVGPKLVEEHDSKML